ncbi:MAG: NADH-quinone oxidoreductase subunit M [Planctomycetes bacterium]|nr:NADH-quinone oxidoreductase subunit M [Planctomycetota bacterium]
MLLTLSIFIPLVTALLAIFIPARYANAVRIFCLAGSLATLAVVSIVVMNYNDDDQTDPNPHHKSQNLLSVLGRKIDAAVAEAVPTADKEESDLPEPALEWLVADEEYSVHAADLKNVPITERDWNLLRLRERIRSAARDRASWRDSGLQQDVLALFGGFPEAERPVLDQDAYDRVLELQLATGTADQRHTQASHVRFVEFTNWIPSFRIHYFVGVDGLSIPLVFLTAFLTVLCLVYSWYMDKATKPFYILFLLMETGLIGVFCALDFFLFYVFWEIVLLPMYFLIGVWGGPRRIYAAIKFFIYTLVGSVLMLVAMLVLYTESEPATFNMLTLMSTAPGFARGVQHWLFAGLFIAFAIKVPVFPFHTWLPDAHVEAPTAGSMVLAGVLLKMGGYGLFRVAYPMLPLAANSTFFFWLVGGLGMVNIVYGALAAMAQKDFKSLVAYSSISHMGFILLGLAAGTVAGYTGGILQMFNHGISSAMMFCLVGCIQHRIHHRNLDDMGGFGNQMPYFTGIAVVGFFTALGLPGLSGFISEALTFLGCFEAGAAYHGFPYARILVYVSLAGVVLTAGYILWSIQRVFLGTTPEKYKHEHDINLREAIALVPLAVFCVLFGVWPALILDYMDPTIQAIVEIVQHPLTSAGLYAHP